jgi:hypothetical protein
MKKLNNFLRLKMKEKENSITPTSNQDATIRSVTRRHFLETGLVAGIGAVVLTPRIASSLQAGETEPLIDLWPTNFLKGMCYSAFPSPYNPSHANHTWIFSGSDIAKNPMAPLWGKSFMSERPERFRGRDDLGTMNLMGVTLVRLYDWAPRDKHLDFLNYCVTQRIKVLAPVSDYFLIRGQGFERRGTLIPELIRSYSNEAGTDYHPAIAAIIMGNEPLIHNHFGVTEAVDFTKDWVRIEQEQFSGFRTPPIGHPVDFGKRGNEPYPQWNYWETLLGGLETTTTRDLQNRLFLAPQPQNKASYLFDNAEDSGMGYVQLTYNRFRKPMLFTEIGHSRSRCYPPPPPNTPCQSWVVNPYYLETVHEQLTRSIEYGREHPEQLKGICHFQFDDKVWVCPTGDPPGGFCESEGTFGVFSHTNRVIIPVTYVAGDFTHWEGQNVPLNVDELTRNQTYEKVVNAYTSH